MLVHGKLSEVHVDQVIQRLIYKQDEIYIVRVNHDISLVI